ncbi:hypothetical protein [Curtobacterium sp. AB7]|uniref:hypothetical protein n=1 Tax=Curtobacterium sp. AB7 TaxID=3349327 RepID=UPI0038367F49
MEISEATVTVHIVDGGTLVGVDQGPIDLARGASTKIPMIVQNNESRANTTGTVTLTAPESTTFDGQTRIDASWRQVGNESWNPVSSIPLTNGRLSNDHKTITFDVNWVENHGAPEQYRYMLNVTADSDAPAGAGQMGFVFAGDSNKGDFRAAGKTTTNLEVAQPELSAEVESVDHNAGSATLVGKATPGATIVVGDQSTEVTESGDWELVVTDLTEGVNNLKVEQKIGDEVVNSKDLEVTINTAAVIGKDGTAVTLERGTSTKVEAQFTTQGSVSRPDAKVTFTAPEGTTFAEGQDTIQGSYRKPGEDWVNRSTTLTDGDLSMDGTTYTFTFKPSTSTWTLPDASLLRWNIEVETPAGAAEGTSSMNTKLVGTAVEGSFNATSTTQTTVDDSRPAAPSATGFFDTDVSAWAGVRGQGAANATIVVKNAAGEEITRTTTNSTGSYEVRIDPNKVGFGEQRLVVTQTVDDATSDGMDVTLDYGQNNPQFTSPTEGGSLPNRDFTLEGTGNAGGKIQVNGVDLRNDDEASIGSADVTDGRWTVRNTEVTLPNGPYQFWANQRTKGGKIVFKGLNVTMEQAKPAAPTATGFFDTDVSAWAGVRGQGAANATIVVKNAAGEEITRTTTNSTGSYEVRIDPNKVGFGEQRLVVTQTVDDATSDGMDVTLDYGQNNPQFTSPTEGGSLPNRDFTLEGTGNAGGKIQVNGVDLRNDDEASIGSADVTDGRWTVRNTEVTLPNGPYQFWANQRTKGGKIVFKGLNVTMEQAKPAAPTATEFFPEDIEQWASITGRGTVGATLTAKNAAGDTIAEMVIVNADGSYNLPIDPNKVGDGVQTLTVTQTLNGAPSDGIRVDMDYGYNTPTFTSPGESAVVANRNLTFTGTGNTGGRLQINGVDLSNDESARIGETTVANNTWTITNNQITLPTGFYQLWANQRTKGGKISFTGLNIQTVQAAPAAPTAVAFFGPTLDAWGGISGTGEVGAEIIVVDADHKEIARTTITDTRGTYNVGIDPSKVGWGEQRFTVTQTVSGVPSKGIVVSLDYGQQTAPTITSPTFGQQIDGSGELTFTGTGSNGSKIVLTGTDFTNDAAFGDTTVEDGRWSITSDLDLPAGNYQFWASERSQGGKYSLTAVDVNITD